jgi:glycosyltransferase involved in cell wall biosynthesis
LAISEFTRQWTSARWGFDSDVLFPPVDTSAQILSKEKLIVSVGRFHGGGGVNKGQLEMLRAFARLRERNSSTLDWRYVCVGGLGTRKDDQQYFSACLAEAAHCGAELIANASPAVVKELYGRASIFWHAAGIGKDEQSTPELLEHFGMVTVEAMAHGAVPVVIAKGGQCEIVQDGTTGLLWHSEGDLVEGTLRLIEQPEELALLGERAKAAAGRYSRASFCESLDRLVPILS